MDGNQRRRFRCQKCNFIWVQFMKAEAPNPRICPKCNSSEWNKSKKVPTSNS